MIFKGTAKRPVGEIEREIKSYGGYMNATTGLDTTSFFITVSNDYFPEAMDLVSDAVMNPVFDENQLQKERSVILNEIRLRNDDPSRRIIKLLFENAYLLHSYRYPIIGYKDLLLKLKREDLVFYHKKYYVPNNIVLAIAGNVDPQDAIETVRETFGKYPRGPMPAVINQIEPQQISERLSKNSAELNLGYLTIGYHSTGILDEDLFPLDTLAMVLGMGDSSRLNKILVKEKELLYSINSFNYTPLYPGLFIITGIGSPGNLENATSQIKKEIQNVKQAGITKAECEKAKALVLSGYLESLQTVQSEASAMAEGQMLAGDPHFSKKYVEGIKAVRLEDVTKVAKKYLKDDNCAIVYLTPDSMASASARASAGKHSPKVTQKTKTNAAKYVLPNGIRVILKEERELPLATIVFSCLGGLRAETKDLNGICNLTSKMLLKGTKIRKEKDIKGSMEKIGGSISSFSGMNSFGLSLSFMSTDTDYALELLEDVVRNSVFPEKEMEKLKNKIAAGIKIEDDDIFQKGLLGLKKGIFKTHPYGRRIRGDVQTLERIKRSDIIKFYKDLLNPESIVVTLVGDFDSEALLKDIKKRFSGIKKSDFIIKTAKEDGLKTAQEKLIHMPKDQALFLIGFKGLDVKAADRYVLEVISSVASGNDGRLFHSVRDKLGLSYTQGLSSIAALDPGYCFFYVATDKKNIERVKDIILSEISKIKSEPVSDIELVSAKNSLITKQIISIQTNAAKAFTLALDELYSLGYKNYLHYKENVEKCGKSDIMGVASKYFDLDKSFSVIILPEERE